MSVRVPDEQLRALICTDCFSAAMDSALMELIASRARDASGAWRCTWCETDLAGVEAANAHELVCEKHPMRAVEKDRAELQRKYDSCAARYKEINDLIPAGFWPAKDLAEAVSKVVEGHANVCADLKALREQLEGQDPILCGDTLVRFTDQELRSYLTDGTKSLETKGAVMVALEARDALRAMERQHDNQLERAKRAEKDRDAARAERDAALAELRELDVKPRALREGDWWYVEGWEEWSVWREFDFNDEDDRESHPCWRSNATHRAILIPLPAATPESAPAEKAEPPQPAPERPVGTFAVGDLVERATSNPGAGEVLELLADGKVRVLWEGGFFRFEKDERVADLRPRSPREREPVLGLVTVSLGSSELSVEGVEKLGRRVAYIEARLALLEGKVQP